MKFQYKQLIITLFTSCAIFSQSDNNSELTTVYSISKSDSAHALSLRRGKHWFSRDERELPLTLPKKVLMIKPVVDFDIIEYGYSDQYRVMPDEDNAQFYLPRIVLSPTDKIDVIVFPYAFIEYALINKVSNIANVLYLRGPSFTIGGGIYRLGYNNHSWIDRRFLITHEYLTRLKVPYNKRSWFSFSTLAKFENVYYSDSEIEISTSIKVNNSIYPTIGFNLKNKLLHHNNDNFTSKLNCIIGYDLLFNRHIRLRSILGAGFYVERAYNWVGMLKFEFRGIW